MKKTSELRNLSVEELQSELLSLRNEQFKLRMKKASGSLDKTHLITLMRKSVAKVKTIMTEKAGK
ncbi:MAG: 50S ribosomal protein L29 [Legionella sp.]|nr:MAG: 50S ribosomal protein L29 [Legionella sp.]